MHNTVKNLIYIKDLIKSKVNVDRIPEIIAVSKTFPIESVLPLIEHGHTHYGENKVQEALDKWSEVKNSNNEIKLHLIGKLQTNKVKFAINIFDYIHSVDNKKLAKKIADEEVKQGKKIKIFLQVNIGKEDQKSGMDKNELINFYNYCNELNLNVVGLMCIPPVNEVPNNHFKEMSLLNKKLNLPELSMGMSSDYLIAAENHSTYLRIGSGIFGKRN